MSSSSTEQSQAAHVEVVMPQMGVSVSEGTIVEWRKQVGDWVEYEETICDISTDKIDTEVPSPAHGRLSEILVEVGTTVEVGTILARLSTDAKPGEAHAAEQDAASAPAAAPTPAGRAVAPTRRSAGGYSPVVQRMAAEHGLDLAQIPGTGRGGRVRKQDVVAHLERGAATGAPPLHTESPYRAPSAPTAPGGPYTPPPAQPLSRIRRTIGEHMKHSLHTAATCTTWIEVDMSRVERHRKERGITALPVVARATIEALGEYPALNAWLEGDQHTVHEQVNLGIAVSLDDEGLIVPVIASAQELTAEGLAAHIKQLAQAARDRTLQPDDVQGGTFTITNPGQFGSIMATPVINQPQVAILDLEAVVKRPVVVTDADGNDALAVRPMTILGLSWDHRALDGVQAAQFLAAIKRRLESL